MVRRTLVAVLAASAASNASAQISYTALGSLYAENFNALSAAAPVTTNIAWGNNTTLAGWNLFDRNSVAKSVYGATNGSDNTGNFFSFGAAGINPSSDRALGGTGSGSAYFGSPASGATAGWIALAVTNNNAHGHTLHEVTINYDGEQWRNGSNATPQSIVMQYGFGATFQSVAVWTAPGAAFNFTTPTNGIGATFLDGNDAANTTQGLGGTIGGLPWTPGSTLWVRFQFLNQVGNDHALALDNFTLIAAVPEPGSLGLTGAVLAGAAWLRRRRK